MRKRLVAAMAAALIISLTAGCAPGDISQFAARAQRVGENVFEGIPVMAETVPPVETVGEAESETVISSEEAENVDRAQEPSGTVALEIGMDETAEDTDGQKTGNTAEAESTDSAETRQADSQNTDGRKSSIPAELTQQMKDALSEKADSFTGKVCGRDRLSKTEQAAVDTALSRSGYGENTGCLVNSAKYDGKTQNTFLFIFDLEVLAARGKMRGELWFYNGDSPVKLMEQMELFSVKLIKSGAGQAFLAQAGKEDGGDAFFYTVKDGACARRFEGASSVTEAGNELCVTWPAECFRYDPLIREWDGTDGSVPYFYTMRENVPQPEEVREISEEEFLKLTAREDSQARQEEMPLTGKKDGKQLSYTFFQIGESRAGYRERSVGIPSAEEDEIDHAVAEYRYTVYELTDGRIKEDNLHYSGGGFYFFNREEQEEELQAMNELALPYKKNRLDRYAGNLKPAGRRALSAVRSKKEYGQEDLAFVYTADFGGAAGEAFVLAGRYDGIFGAPVCDLWYVSGATARLLLENLPLKGADIYSCADTRLLMIEGYGAFGEKEYLYGATDEGPRRLFETAERINILENGDIRVWLPDGDMVLPYDYHMVDGKEILYPAAPMNVKELKLFKNGEAVYERLLKQAGGREDRLSCLFRKNQVFHVMVAPTDEGTAQAGYENYELRDGYLILWDSGRGAYRADADAAAEPTD